MHAFQTWVHQNPEKTAYIFAALAFAGALQAFRAGYMARGIRANHDLAASLELGG